MARTKYQLAYEAWPHLTEWAKRREVHSYADLASALGYSAPRVARQPLWALADFCTEKHLPPLTSIIVGKETGKPGAGFKWEGGFQDAQQRAFDHDWGTVQRPFSPGQFLPQAHTTVPAPAPGAFLVPDIVVLVNGRGPYQGKFRRYLEAVYGRECGLCSTRHKEFLVASHIVPWSIDSQNRLNPRNGILLCLTHDRAFERGLLRIHVDLTTSLHLSDTTEPGTELERALGRTRKRLRVSQPKWAPGEEFLTWRMHHPAPGAA